jgi:hypothetical protein
LDLLTRDGAVSVCFKPSLAPEQYSELQELTHHAASADDLRKAILDAAGRWQRAVQVY